MRRRWIQDPATGRLVPEAEWAGEVQRPLTVIGDIPEEITEHLGTERDPGLRRWTGRRSRKRLMKEAGVVEWCPGMQKKRPRYVPDPMVTTEVRSGRTPKEVRADLERRWRDYHRG